MLLSVDLLCLFYFEMEYHEENQNKLFKNYKQAEGTKENETGGRGQGICFFSLLQDLSSLARIKPRAGKHQGLPTGPPENSQNTTFKTRFRTKTG